MNKLKLLPRWCRFLGLALVIPCIGMFVIDPEIVFGESTWSIFGGDPSGRFVVEVFSLFDSSANDPNLSWYAWVKNDLSNELMLTAMLFGTYCIAFAKIKEEDEYSNQLRLEAMSQALVYNGIILLIFNWLIYDGLFLYVMISQLFSFLLLFSFIFAMKIRNQRKLVTYEE
ncbi:MAG: hypothetical protein RIC95_11560 [Vicingaceae bacterium]